MSIFGRARVVSPGSDWSKVLSWFRYDVTPAYVANSPVLGQRLDIDVEPGGTAILPLGDYNRNRPVGLALQIGRDPALPLLKWTPGNPLDTATIEEYAFNLFKDRLSLVQRPDGIAAQLTSVTSNDTGKDVFYQVNQERYQGPKMYINLIAPPPNVTSLNVTDIGMDYVNITWPQVIPWDSATVWYYIEYRRPGVNSETWHRTANISATDATDQLTMRVEGLLPALWYEIRVVAANRFGQSRSATRKALTKAPPPNVTSLNVTDIGMDYFNITWPQVIPLDSAPVWYYVEYRRPDVNSETWHRTANISATNGTDNLATRVEGLLPAVWYEIRVMAANRFGQSRSGIKKALTKGSGKHSVSGKDAATEGMRNLAVLEYLFKQFCMQTLTVHVQMDSRQVQMDRRQVQTLNLKKLIPCWMVKASPLIESLQEDSHQLHLLEDSHQLHLQEDSHQLHLQEDSHQLHLQEDSHQLHLLEDSHQLHLLEDSHQLQEDSHQLQEDSHQLHLQEDSHQLHLLEDSHQLHLLEDSHQLQGDSHQLQLDRQMTAF
ncbi:hypothetical protein Bbelb_161660 [Branchiostoma belcheri]|nr:hypothetical protein Bbelb_161660 [Branchiostoma belcheri]